MIGKKFNKWTIISQQGKQYVCRCECGRELLISYHFVTSGSFKCCPDCLEKTREIIAKFAAKYYKEGWSISNLAKFVNISYKVMRDIIIKYKIPIRTKVEAQFFNKRLGNGAYAKKPMSPEHRENLRRSIKKWYGNLSEETKKKYSLILKNWRRLPKEEKDRLRQIEKTASSFNEKLAYSFFVDYFKKREWAFEENIKRYILGRELNIELLLINYKLVIKIDNDLHYVSVYGQEYLENIQKKDTLENMYLREAGYSVLRVRLGKFNDKWLRQFNSKLRKIKAYGTPSIWYI